MPVKLPRLVKSTRGWPWVTYRDVKGYTKRARVLAVGTDTTRAITAATTTKAVTVTTTVNDKHIVATAGVFTAADVGSVISGNDLNIPAGSKIATFTDATHVILDTNASLTDAIGTATTFTLRGIVATVGAFDSVRDIGAALSGNDAKLGAGRTIVSVQDGTHATMSACALLADAGTATNVTRVADQGSVKVKIPHRQVSASAILDNLPVMTDRAQTGRVINRRGPA